MGRLRGEKICRLSVYCFSDGIGNWGSDWETESSRAAECIVIDFGIDELEQIAEVDGLEGRRYTKRREVLNRKRLGTLLLICFVFLTYREA